MKSALKILICGYIFFSSWTDAFALAPTFPLHVLILLTILTFYFVGRIHKLKIPRRIYKAEDFLLMASIGGVCLSALANPNEKSFNYVAAYILTLGIGYLILKGLVYESISYITLLRLNAIAVVFVGFFTSLEFTAEILIDFDIQLFLPRENTAFATFLGGQLSRSYGLAHEPTIVAFYFNTLAPIGLWTIWRRKVILQISGIWSLLVKSLITLVTIFGYLTTFSVALIFLPAGYLTFLGLRAASCRLTIYRNVLVKASIIAAIITSTFALNVFNVQTFMQTYTSPLLDKVLFAEKSVSAQTRLGAWMSSLQEIPENPLFGKGVGYLSTQGLPSSLNWYLFLTLEGGLLSSIPMILFLFLSCYRILNSRIEGQAWFASGFIAGAMHLLIISTFYHPFLWILLIIFHVSNEQKRLEHHNAFNIKKASYILVEHRI